MKRRATLLSTLFALFLSSMAAASPGGPMGGGMGGADKGMGRMMDTLDLSDEQQEAVWTIMDEMRPQMRPLMISMQKARKALTEMVDGGAYDEARLRELADAQGKAFSDLIVLKTQLRSRIRDQLTPEQQEQFKALKPERRHGPRGE